MKTDEEKKQLIMKQIEKKTEQQIALNIAAGKITNPILEKNEKKQEQNNDILLTLMTQGAKEFREKTGRGMEYGEMRALYG
jgi:transposase